MGKNQFCVGFNVWLKKLIGGWLEILVWFGLGLVRMWIGFWDNSVHYFKKRNN